VRPRTAPRTRLPRHLHPGAWWVWALGLATAASRTTNPLLLLLVVAVAGFVVVSRRTDAPWARAYRSFLLLGLAVLGFRVVFQVLFGAPVPGTVLVTLPSVPLPDWAAGVRLGGPVTAEGLAAAVYEGLQLATLIACVGAANALASPSRLLRCLPAALYETGVAVVVAMSVAPQTLANVRRVRAARRLRGYRDRGLRGLGATAMPVLEGALERALDLAAAMDARGYGRTGDVPRATRRLTAGLTVAGLLGVLAGTYGLLDAGSPPLLGLPLLGAGVAVAAAGFVLGGRRSVRTRYRPDPWALPEWCVAGSGVVAAAGLVATEALGLGGLAPSTYPLVAPDLPGTATVALLVGLLPAWAAPPPPPTTRPATRPAGVPRPGRPSREEAPA
jgi:energy-coupling factor transport system permease protein